MKRERHSRRSLLTTILSPLFAALLASGVGFSQAQSTNNNPAQPAAILKTDFTVGRSPNAILFDGTNIWVANQMADNVMKLSALDGIILGTFPTGTRPAALAYDGENVWVANKFSNSVMKLRASDGSLLETIKVGRRPEALFFDGSSIWVASCVKATERVAPSSSATVPWPWLLMVSIFGWLTTTATT
jgi:DNA-binding beta-propeller fold protein YncE